MKKWLTVLSGKKRSTRILTAAVAILFGALCLFSSISIHNEQSTSLSQSACSSACLSHQQAVATYSQRLDEDEIEPTPPQNFPQLALFLPSLFLIPALAIIYLALTKKRILLTTQLRF